MHRRSAAGRAPRIASHSGIEPCISVDTRIRASISDDLADFRAELRRILRGHGLRSVLPAFENGIAVAPSLEHPAADLLRLGAREPGHKCRNPLGIAAFDLFRGVV